MFLFAAMGAVASPIDSASNEIDARAEAGEAGALAKYYGVSDTSGVRSRIAVDSSILLLGMHQIEERMQVQEPIWKDQLC